MKKILLSVGSILVALGLVAGATGATYYGGNFNWENWYKPWTSHGNEFKSGTIDLKIDNESYVTNDDGELVRSPQTSWGPSSLANKKFFNFLDLKPGDIGEDTISLHVKENKAWACMNVELTGTPEHGQNEPETLVDPTSGTNDGELQNHLYFNFWADDGDNVFETGEVIFKSGLVKDIFDGEWWRLADSSGNIWGGSSALEPNKVKYIGKAWCFGAMTNTPVPQDGKGKLNNSSNGPLVRGTGFTCSGQDVGNIVQSDGIKADVTFHAVQARNNSYFCSGEVAGTSTPPVATSTLFEDSFESYKNDKKCDEGGKDQKWDADGEVRFKDIGGSHKKVAILKGDKWDEAVLVSDKINTQGYKNITFKYDRKLDDTSGPVNSMTLTVQYKVGNGSWQTLETVNGESDWTTKTFSLSPQGDNKPSVYVRFVFEGSHSSTVSYIDNVVITGVSI